VDGPSRRDFLGQESVTGKLPSIERINATTFGKQKIV